MEQLQSRMFQLGCSLFRCYLRVQGLVVIVVWYVLFYKFQEPQCLQGASSNFLVLRIRAHKTIRVSHALWHPANSGKEGLRKWLLSYYWASVIFQTFFQVLWIHLQTSQMNLYPSEFHDSVMMEGWGWRVAEVSFWKASSAFFLGTIDLSFCCSNCPHRPAIWAWSGLVRNADSQAPLRPTESESSF